MTITNDIMQTQRQKVFGQQPSIQLIEPCHIGNGILQHTEEEKKRFIQCFFQSNSLIQLFIPASGSGSRMFQFLFDFLESPNDDNRGKVERFLNHINDFAFSKKMAAELLQRLENNQISLAEFAQAILDETGLGFGNLPKGLIPFHKYGYFILNPFQEQILQAAILNSGVSKVHFSINSDFEHVIQESIAQVKALSGYAFSTELSEQDKDSNSIAFDENQNVVLKKDGTLLTRPAGHGALLSNLNDLDADIIFIKNIDNIRYQNQVDTSLQHIQYLSGVLCAFNEKSKVLYEAKTIDRNKLVELLSDFQLVQEIGALQKMSDEQVRQWLNRPRRVCGMVKNEGQPGGGPFWVNQNGTVSKQIVEKSQIPINQQQHNVSIKNTHFNPVMIACSTKGLMGEKLDLNEFADDSSYFIVQKQYEGKTIRFLEQPGLWNGKMAHWNSIFVEIPTETFSPVKSILDLLDKAHREI